MKPVRRLGVLGDIHAEDQRLERALGFFGSAKVDAIFAVGDIIDGPGDVERAIGLLLQYDVVAVAGNHERWFLEGSMRSLPHATTALSETAHAWTSALPKTLRYATPAGPLLLCHGIGDDDMTKLLPDSCDYDVESHAQLQRLLLEDEIRFVVCGHTHRAMVRTFGRLTVINAGTLYREHDPCVAVLDFDDETFDHVRFDADGTLS